MRLERVKSGHRFKHKAVLTLIRLLDRQEPDGSWLEEEWTGTGFPRVFYLRYHLYPIYFPLLALGTYEREGSKTRATRRRPAREVLLRSRSVPGTA